ncbi:MAG: RsmD family RNA methyltransferase, partial [Planctomycetota bacterium]
MRIIAGNARGRRLLLPDLDATRPLLEQARGALFNMLMPHLQGATVLDCYAGSGAIGLEALSRGATEATFIEMAPEALDALRQNIETCRCE